MGKIKNILTGEYIFFIVVAVIITVLCENDIIHNGIFADNKQAEFISLSIMELVTIISIPVSMKLPNIKKVKEHIKANPDKNILRWGTLRLNLIGIPLIINTLLYYFYMHVAFGYMAIIGLICLAFIYPGKEIHINESSENK